MTPEGRVKQKVTKVLKSFGNRVYYFMPVQHGIGASGLDYHCCASVSMSAVAFFIETKAPGKRPTDRQQTLIDHLRIMGARVFVIANDEDVEILDLWLRSLL